MAHEPMSPLEIEPALRVLFNACDETLARCDALRALGEARGLWTPEEFEATLLGLRGERREFLAAIADPDLREMIRRLLIGGGRSGTP